MATKFTGVHVTAAMSLHGYHDWRASLVALPVGTIIQWVEPYSGVSLSTSVKAGQAYKIKAVNQYSRVRPIVGDCDKVYDMVLVSKSGREYKKKMGWSVEHIARGLHEGKLMQVIPEIE